MDSRLRLCFIGSLLAHGAMLAWPGLTRLQPPQIGGAAQTLRVALAPAASERGAQPRAEPVHEPTPQRDSSRREIAPARREPVARAAPQPSPFNAHAPETRPAPAAETAAAKLQPVPVEPSPLAAAPPATPVDAPDIGERISAALQHELSKRFEYPWLARKRGWQGRVTLSLRVHENGDLSDWAVSRTSGYAVLDRSALDCARRITRLPGAARWLEGRSLQLMIPVQYRLLDS